MKNLTVSDYRSLHRKRQGNDYPLYYFLNQVGVMHKLIENEGNQENQDFYDRFKTITNNPIIKF